MLLLPGAVFVISCPKARSNVWSACLSKFQILFELFDGYFIQFLLKRKQTGCVVDCRADWRRRLSEAQQASK